MSNKSPWWLSKPRRMVQTNLREIDASLEPDAFVASLKAFDANVVLFNVGGIVANYPTELADHYRNPYLKDDFVGKVLARVHQEGIRFIARFDFSKVNEVIAARHPEWLYKSSSGETVCYNQQVHTCINGAYQQAYCFSVLEEVIARYPIDGVFFNMIGYVTRDYSGVYHGICQCANCRQRFAEYSAGLALPKQEDAQDPVFRQYEAFRRDTKQDRFTRITRFIKDKRADIAICNYTQEGVDIFRKESNSGIARPLPEWNYSASENVKTVLGTWDNTTVSNAAVHFVDFAMRHAAVSPHLSALRLAQDLVQGAWLDYYVIGTLLNQDDRVCFDAVKDLYRFHAAHEDLYSQLESLAEVCLLMPSYSSMYGSGKEFRGLFRILSESHVPFDVLHDSALFAAEAREKLERYKVVVLPDMRAMNETCVAVLDRYVAQGGKLLATGATATCDARGNPLGEVRLASVGVTLYEAQPQTQGTYFRVTPEDKRVLSGFDELDILYLYGEWLACTPEGGATTHLRFIPAAMFGPPEKCYYTTETDTPGMVVSVYGQGRSVFIPWGVGRHYERLSHHAHASLVRAALTDILAYVPPIAVSAPPLVEVSLHRKRHDNGVLVSLVNLSGQLGTAFHAPLPIRDIGVRLQTSKPPASVRALRIDQELPFEHNDEALTFALPELALLESVVVL